MPLNALPNRLVFTCDKIRKCGNNSECTCWPVAWAQLEVLYQALVLRVTQGALDNRLDTCLSLRYLLPNSGYQWPAPYRRLSVPAVSADQLQTSCSRSPPLQSRARVHDVLRMEPPVNRISVLCHQCYQILLEYSKQEIHSGLKVNARVFGFVLHMESKPIHSPLTCFECEQDRMCAL